MEGANWLSTIPAEETVTIVVPLYGYWSDLKVQELNKKTIEAAMANIVSRYHKYYLIVVAEPGRTSKDIQDWFASKNVAGNTLGIAVDNMSTYGEYLQEGIDAALERTGSKFIAVLNPWAALQNDGALDSLLERVNKSDAQIVSGFDLRTYKHNGLEGVPDAEFAAYQFAPAMEFKDFCGDFWCMTRQSAQMISIDQEYKTHQFIASDVQQSCAHKAMTVISSQFFPIFSFDVNWSILETNEDYEADRQHFLSKWKFDPTLKQ